MKRALLRLLWRLVKSLLAVAIAVAAAPVTLVAAGSAAVAWWRGWPPRRLYVAAAWCLPMVLAWLIATAFRHPGGDPAWFAVGTAPYRSWTTMWQLLRHGRATAAAATIAPPAIPLGLLAGGAAWAYRIFRMETGAAGLSPASRARFDARLWRRQVRAARGLLAAPGALPLLRQNDGVIIGSVIRTVGHRARPIAWIPYARLRSHQVVIGTTGTGKTTLLLRLWAGFMAGGLRGAAAARRRPLLVVLDCKGGASSRKVADRFRRVLRDAGARSVSTWPDEASLRIWDLPPDQLISTLLDLIEHGSGAAAYYADVMEALVALAVNAPSGPPAGAADFLSRLDAGWLLNAYSASEDAEAVAILRSAQTTIPDTALRFRTLWRRLGAGFDGYGGFGDADAWYCVLEGTADRAVAEAQARALVDLLAHYAVSGANREILLAVDEFSAVSRRLPIWQLYERARSLGLAVQVSAQSWEGLAGDADERYRIAATAEGGIWLLRTPRPGPIVELAGTRPVVETSRRLTGDPGWDDTGTSRLRQAPVLDPDLVRRLDVGQVAYVYRGGVTYLQVRRLIGGQAALNPGIPAGSPRGHGGREGPPRGYGGRAAPRSQGGSGGDRSPRGLTHFLDETFGEFPGAGG